MSESPRKEKVRIWGERIEAQLHSGKSVREFCEEHQIKQPTFFYWQKKFRKLPEKSLKVSGSPSPMAGASRFVALSQKIQGSLKSPLIHLPNGVSIDLGGGLEFGAVRQFIRDLCGVGHPPKEGHNAKP